MDQAEELAIFAGCENEESPHHCSNQKFLEYIYKHIELNTQDDHSESILIVSFIIEKDGSVCNVEFLKGQSTLERSNIKKLLNESQKWIPGKNDGKIVRTRYKLPLKIHYE